MTHIKKRIYEKPTMMVVQLKNQQHLLQASQVDVYNDTTEEQW